jgi:hypothetical protein
MKIWHAPPGKLIRGHVLDVQLKPFLRALQDYDKQLYVAWNPKKLKGHGCWEIRRLPNQKTAIYQGTHQGMSFFKLTYIDRRDIHHVLDCAFLNYDVLRKLKEIDTFRLVKDSGYASLDDLLAVKAAEHKEKQQTKAAANLAYAIKQNKSAMSAFLEMVRSGVHPAEVLKSTKWVHNS